MSDGTGELIPFPDRLSVVAREEEPLDVPIDRAPSYRDCRHAHVQLDAKARALRCKDCEQVIDPIDWLETLAMTWERYVYRWRSANGGIRRAEDELVKLRGQERNAKERVKRAKKWLRDHSIDPRIDDLDRDDDLFDAYGEAGSLPMYRKAGGGYGDGGIDF